MKLSLSVVVLYSLATIELVVASRILFLFPSPSKSHLVVVQGLSTTLAKKGHEVTVVSPFPMTKPLKNYRDIVTPLNKEAANFASDMVKNQKVSMFKQMPKIMTIFQDIGEEMLENAEFKKVMKEEKFDLVVIGIAFNNFLLGVADHFKCPSIVLSVNTAGMFINALVGNPSAVSSVPHMFYPVQGHMNFFERSRAFTIFLIESATSIYFNSWQRGIYEYIFLRKLMNGLLSNKVFLASIFRLINIFLMTML